MTAEQEAEIGRRMAMQAAEDMRAWRARSRLAEKLIADKEADRHVTALQARHSNTVTTFHLSVGDVSAVSVSSRQRLPDMP